MGSEGACARYGLRPVPFFLLLFFSRIFFVQACKQLGCKHRASPSTRSRFEVEAGATHARVCASFGVYAHRAGLLLGSMPRARRAIAAMRKSAPSSGAAVIALERE